MELAGAQNGTLRCPYEVGPAEKEGLIVNGRLLARNSLPSRSAIPTSTYGVVRAA
jgi:hypothetical protein